VEGRRRFVAFVLRETLGYGRADSVSGHGIEVIGRSRSRYALIGAFAKLGQKQN